ncbi:hypothetical protein [Salininema proteolyticum]|uniref:Tetratricopeptide repeat protein n=1 Tax=Salininema proteolyticum TaxID=1607685 RepID=A0ABV8TXF8_9ACTN
MAYANADEIWSMILSVDDRPDGVEKVALLEEAAQAAESLGDERLVNYCLVDLVSAHRNWTGTTEMVPHFARLCERFEERRETFDDYSSHRFLWSYRWIVQAMTDDPDYSLDLVEAVLMEMRTAYLQEGYSDHAGWFEDMRLAYAIGDWDRMWKSFRASEDCDPDSMSDCNACRASFLADVLWDTDASMEDVLGFLNAALEVEDQCRRQPHETWTTAMFAHARLGDPAMARESHLRGFTMARGRVDLLDLIVEHLQFCAVSGNEARAVAILEEHAEELYGDFNPAMRLGFAEVLVILCRRFLDLGQPELPLPGPDGNEFSAAELAEWAESERVALAAEFDARNGNGHVGESSAGVIEFGTFPVPVPMGFKNYAFAQQVEDDGLDEAVTESDLDMAILEAQRRSEDFLPAQTQAWQRVGAIADRLGMDLPGSLGAQVAYARTATSRESYDTAQELEAVADRFDEAGMHGRALTIRVDALGESPHLSTYQVMETLDLYRRQADELLNSERVDDRDYYSIRAATLRIEAQRAHYQVIVEDGDPDALDELRRRALELDALLQSIEHRWAHFRRCDVLDLAGGLIEDPEERLNLYEESFQQALLSENPGVINRAAMSLSTTHMALDQPESAIPVAEKGLEDVSPFIHPGFVITLHHVLADAHSWMGGEDESQRACLQMAVLGDRHGISTGGIIGRHMMALSLRRQGRPLCSAEYLQAILPDLDDDDVDRRINVHVQLAEIYEECFQPERGIDHAEAAIRLMEEDEEYHDHHVYTNTLWTAAHLLQGMHRFDEALAMFPRAAVGFEEHGFLQLWARASRSISWLLVEPPGADPSELPPRSEDDFTKALSTMAYVAGRLKGEVAEEDSDPKYVMQCRIELGHTFRQHSQLLYRAFTDRHDRLPETRDEVAPLLELEVRARDAYLAADPPFTSLAVEAVESAMNLLYSVNAVNEATVLGNDMLGRLSADDWDLGENIRIWCMEG